MVSDNAQSFHKYANRVLNDKRHFSKSLRYSYEVLSSYFIEYLTDCQCANALPMIYYFNLDHFMKIDESNIYGKAQISRSCSLSTATWCEERHEMQFGSDQIA